MALAHRLLRAATGLRPSDVPQVVPLGVSYGLLLVTLYMVKPVRNSLFLSELGAERLPVALTLVALAGALMAGAVTRLGDRSSLARLVSAVFGVGAVSLVVFWGLLRGRGAPTAFVFYVGASLFSTFAASTVWLVAGAVLDARQARRGFGLIGALGILGAVVGGLVTRASVSAIGTLNLLPIAAGVLLVALALLSSSARRAPVKGRQRSLEKGPPLTQAIGHPLVRALALLTLLSAAVSTIEVSSMTGAGR